MKVDTSVGFELCSADACRVDDLFCTAAEDDKGKPVFEILKNMN